MADFPSPPKQRPLPDPVEIEIIGDSDAAHLDEKSGALEIPLPDGSVVIDFSPQDEADDDGDFEGNLADKIDDLEIGRIAQELLEGIKADDDSRSDWLATRARGIDILGLKLQEPRGDIGASSAPIEGMSTVRHPVLLEAVLRFQATARGELLPSTGPCKVRNDGDFADGDSRAEVLERDINYYLTSVATEYYPDTDRMLFYVGFGGCAFKKVYNCPLRQRPVSESVDAKDVIVSNAATDLKNAGRVTHVITMRPSVLRRMQLADAYRDVDLSPPTPEPNRVDEKIASVQGVRAKSDRPQDHSFTIYECYCELDIPGYEHKQDDKVTGLPLPYRVAIEKDSRKVLEIRRNWKEGDETYLAKTVLVKYPFVAALGFYDIGLLHILGNSANALTAAWREMLDAGMFATFPGFLYAKQSGRQLTNEFRVPPGGGVGIETGGQPISSVVAPLPYKDISAGLIGLTQNIEQNTQRVGGTAEMNVGEGKAEIPVGTTLALIEQATKVQDAVHKRLHQAQSEEFALLKECFQQDPEALWRHNPKAAQNWDVPTFIAALNDAALIPAADPNTPSHMHRAMKAMALKQLQATNPPLYNPREVDTRVLRMLGFDNPEALFAPPAPPNSQPDPQLIAAQAKMIDSQTKQQALGLKHQDMQSEFANSAADRASAERVQELRVEQERIIHAGDLYRDHQKQAAQLAFEQMKLRHSSASDHIMQMREHAHDAQLAQGGLVVDHLGQERQRMHDAAQRRIDLASEHELQARQQEHDARIAHLKASQDVAKHEAQMRAKETQAKAQAAKGNGKDSK